MPKRVTRYKCDYCTKNYSTMSNAKRHEEHCFRNPKKQACITCKFFRLEYENVHYGDQVDTISFNFCDAKKEELKNLKANCSLHCSNS